ncbi:hypothetical protein B0H17DRAFT_1132210 [Mycena rosella]|uniref:F-box domain-containing protein n=1 Tax=Mycena rosella TaxID=1033263 RepID=A0AAD7DLV7_MYCRO|nr:hypothetical protein B0H17DRAFT_1132210 [Mycena rosella]
MDRGRSPYDADKLFLSTRYRRSPRGDVAWRADVSRAISCSFIDDRQREEISAVILTGNGGKKAKARGRMKLAPGGVQASYPVRVLTLPPEVTSEIFIYSLPTSYNARERNSANPYEAPMLLVRVRRAWRAIALATPALRTTIALEIREIQDTHMFKAWLKHDDEINVITETLATRSRTMQSLELETHIEHLQDMDSHWNFQFPLLQMLRIRLPDRYYFSEEVSPIEIFSDSPLLRKVSLIGVQPNLHPHSSVFCGISCQNPPAHPAHRTTAFTRCALGANLTECSFTLASYGSDTDLIPLTHSDLQSLALSARASGILKYLSLPALKTLQILEPGVHGFYNEALVGFLWRSSASLRKLIIRCDYTEFESTSFSHMA